MDVVALEATDVVIQSLLIALYVDPSDAKAVEQAIGVVVEKYVRYLLFQKGHFYFVY